MSRRYLTALLSLSLLLLLISFGIMWAWPEVYESSISCIVGWFCLLTLGQHSIIDQAMKRSARSFVNRFLALTVGCVFLHIIVIMIYLFIDKEHWKAFTLTYMVCFVIYLAFETAAIVKNIKTQRNQQSGK